MADAGAAGKKKGFYAVIFTKTVDRKRHKIEPSSFLFYDPGRLMKTYEGYNAR